MTRAPSKPKIRLRQRFELLLGPDAIARKIAALFDRDVKELFRWERNGWPYYTVLVLELMEHSEPENWPQRIKQALKGVQNSVTRK